MSRGKKKKKQRTGVNRRVLGEEEGERAGFVAMPPAESKRRAMG